LVFININVDKKQRKNNNKTDKKLAKNIALSDVDTKAKITFLRKKQANFTKAKFIRNHDNVIFNDLIEST